MRNDHEEVVTAHGLKSEANPLRLSANRDGRNELLVLNSAQAPS
jgi:hypothetical protein